jgi:hypothetical protein
LAPICVCHGLRTSGEHGIFHCLSEWHFTVNTPYNAIHVFLHLQKKRCFKFFSYSHLEAQEAFAIYLFAQVATVSRAAWINDYARIRNCQLTKSRGLLQIRQISWRY